ncbi:glycogen operon protein [Paramicrobacterium humi]|uniref:Glycogen operon protein n=2 Tax=Paramicrobacterium humi TaxID=640635 RepID=A0A1H4TQW7_9MICO|nr:glycogen operon protein [Microbacterium humi]
MTAETLLPLGLQLTDDGGAVSVWSHNATSIELVVFGDDEQRVPMERGDGDVWMAHSSALRPGTGYGFRVAGENGRFDPSVVLLDPYAKGVVSDGDGGYRSVAVDESFDWGEIPKPRIALQDTIIYETHVKGYSKQNRAIPEELRGTYAGLAHDESIARLKNLGVTSIELLPVQAFRSEQRLLENELANYWGYNTLAFFAPHPAYASESARAEGPSAVLREFKQMVRRLHEAELEVILDVVYNHTAEEGPKGPTLSLRGIDDASYYRQGEDCEYIDTTGVGNTLNTSTPAAAQLVLDSLRYWATELQVDGFRFDLATALGRGEHHEYSREHPLLAAISADPVLSASKLIAEPWDVGVGGWQTGNFPDGWSEWNDKFRNRARSFWLTDIAYARQTGRAPVGIGGFATRLAGSSNTFSAERGPLASVNFISAHDGFTLADLVSYDVKHNEANKEDGADGTDNNLSFNHGVEGPTGDREIQWVRRKAMRNLLATLLLSSGVPMITAGDEFGRSQEGNNNPYCHDSPLTWLPYQRDQWQDDLLAHARRLITLRHENLALRPQKFARADEKVPGSSTMTWFDSLGNTMSEEDWQDGRQRTLQYLATSTPYGEEKVNSVLLVVHGNEIPGVVTLPRLDRINRYEHLWSSADDRPRADPETRTPGDVIGIAPASMSLFRVHRSAGAVES